MTALFALVPAVVALLTFGAVTSVLVAWLPDPQRRQARARLAEAEASPPQGTLILRWLFPLARALTRFTDRVPLPAYRERVRRKLLAAGLRDELQVPEFVALKAILPVLFLALALFWQQRLSLGTDLVALLLGFVFPDLWLNQMAQARQRAILRGFPTAVDMISLSVEAGLDFGQAIARLVDRSPAGPLRDELALFLQEMRMGRTRAEALRALAERVNIPEVSSFVTVLIQADQLGASIGDTLRTQADLMRTERFRKAEIAGGQAATKLLFPLVFFIFPTLFIILFGPIIIRFLGGTLLP